MKQGAAPRRAARTHPLDLLTPGLIGLSRIAAARRAIRHALWVGTAVANYLQDMRSSIAIAVAVAVAALGCTDPVMKPLDASNDAAACGCHLEGSGLSAVLVMSFSCYCAAYGDGCTGELAATCADFRQRFDYPACGLTDVRGVPATD